MLTAEYGVVQTARSIKDQNDARRLAGRPQCSECSAYDGWHYGNCPEWHTIVMRQVRLAEAAETTETTETTPEPLEDVCIHDNDAATCWECYQLL